MATNCSFQKPNMKKRKRSHALNTTNSVQKLNLQIVRLDDGRKIRMTAKEKKTFMKNEKAA